jgi:hypothetical protein
VATRGQDTNAIGIDDISAVTPISGWKHDDNSFRKKCFVMAGICKNGSFLKDLFSG